jgi:hypothetical protein
MPDQEDSDAISKMAPNHRSSLHEAKEEEENGVVENAGQEKSGDQIVAVIGIFRQTQVNKMKTF